MVMVMVMVFNMTVTETLTVPDPGSERGIRGYSHSFPRVDPLSPPR